MKKILFLFFFLSGSYFSAFSQTDTTQIDLRAWKLIDGFLPESVNFDTVINDFQIMNPVERFSVSNTWLGNVGSAWKSNVFFTETPVYQSDFIFDRNFQPYIFSKENQVFYHAKKPYFDITWATGTKTRDENQLYALYTQNINEKWNIGFRYRLTSSKGEFPNNLVSEHSMNAFASYTGERYSMHAAFIRNKFKTEESGGINSTDLPLDPEFAQANLAAASSIYYKKTFFLSQEYRFGFTKKVFINDTTTESTFKELVRINHVFSYDNNYRIYYDEDTSTTFYENRFLNDNLTRDSVRLARFENALYWTFKEIKRSNFNGRLTVGAALENLKWINTGDVLHIDTITSNIDSTLLDTAYNNIRLMANLDARTKMFIFNANASYYLSQIFGATNKAENYIGNLLISKGILIGKQQSDFYVKLHLSRTSPTEFERQYYSNNFEWENSFGPVLTAEGRVGLKIPAVRTGAEFGYARITDYVYFNSDALPSQYSDAFNVMSFRLHKDFKFGHFFSRNRAVYQLIPDAVDGIDGVINIPKWAVYHSFFLDLDFLKKYSIEAQLGYDVNYTSRFKALGYMPATGQFYQKDGFYTGHYPVLNVFLNLRIKTVLLSFKFEHLNNQFVYDKYYYLLDRYAYNTTAFKFAVSWRFMN